MELNKYQREARSFAFYPKDISGIDYCILGMCGEAGEVANKRKKELRDDKHLTDDIIDELGDVLWYLANTCKELGIDLDLVAKRNLDKLTKRHGKETLWTQEEK